MDELSSLKNPRIKKLISLQESRERRKSGVFVTEGIKEIKLALDCGYELAELFVCSEIFELKKQGLVDFSELYSNKTYYISNSVFEKIAYRENRDGVIAVFYTKSHILKELQLKENSIVVVIESVEKPGNLGAILRTADSAGVDAVIVCEPLTDLYNPNVIRSGVGCVFTNKIAVATNEEAMAWLKKGKFNIFSAALVAGARSCYDIDYTGPTAIVLGSEANGLSRFWLENSTENIIIPMFGKIDSMNVSVSCAIIVYETVRQRKFNKK